MTDEKFLNNIGKKLGSGFQGIVHEFGNNKVVKQWRLGKSNNENNIINEAKIATLSGKIGCGPRIFDFRQIDNTYYMVMEKVRPVQLTKNDIDDVIELFDTLIENGIVNYDGSFGRTSDGELVLFDYGVSIIDKDSPIDKYCKESDFFYNFADMHGIEGLYDNYCTKSKKKKSPSTRKSPKR